VNSAGFDLTDRATLDRIEAARGAGGAFEAAPILAGPVRGAARRAVINPATGATVGHVTDAVREDLATALQAARPWGAPASERTAILGRAADLYEGFFGGLMALLAREAGKTLPDAVSELREAVDFLRFYGAGAGALTRPPLGIVTAISPWNFPLAIFTGQIAAALAAGNAVLAKPAEQTPLIAAHAVRLLHKAGVPASALQLLPGDGPTVGAALTSDPRVKGVVFTGSTDTARAIRSAMAANLDPGAPLIAETGGLNAMIVDSTALPEQAVRDVIASAFQSAGQRCSALRCLYLQEDVAPHVTGMLLGAMRELKLGDPWHLATDIGPVIDAEAQAGIAAHVARARAEGRVVGEVAAPAGGTFVAPTVIRVTGIADLKSEVFGPVLHLATFRAEDLPRVVDDINATGYGLTFGLHTRIDNRVQEVTDRIRAGNLYVNRNTIGAVVGSQPFGGEGLSGTGPKAGGPDYLARFTLAEAGGPAGEFVEEETATELSRRLAAAARAPGDVLARHDLPGPTGETNRLTLVPRPPLLCLGPGPEAARRQADAVQALGGRAVAAGGRLAPESLTTLEGISGALWWGDTENARACARALARREGPILPLLTGLPDRAHVAHERHVCVDTTASGGNAALLAEAGAE
jgi:RHH-type proline utilization regulon transcriptional repressor/proline dehydrogenase/delta 1-pyrroline-5-carboxylate dehydrogenase